MQATLEEQVKKFKNVGTDKWFSDITHIKLQMSENYTVHSKNS